MIAAVQPTFSSSWWSISQQGTFRVAWATIDGSKDLVHTGSSYNFRTQDSKPYDFFINPDETILIMYWADTKSFYSYEYGTAGDISTLSYTGKSMDISTIITTPYGFTLSPDGTRWIIIDKQKAVEFTLSTAYDASTLSLTWEVKNFKSVNNKFARCEYSNDGKKLFMIWDWILWVANLPTAYTLDWWVIADEYKSTKHIDANSGGTWNKNGSQYFITTINGLYELNTPDAYDLTGLYNTGVGSSAHQFGGTRNISKLHFSPDESRAYGIAVNDRLYEYSVTLI